MASLLATPIYISAQDVRDTTTNAALAALTDAEIEALITQAQYIIENYIRCYGTKFVEWQEFIFPIDVDGVSTIPDDIKLATFYIVERLFALWTITASAGGNVIEERRTEHTVKYSDNSSSDIENLIPYWALQILNNYASRFIKQSITNVQSVC